MNPYRTNYDAGDPTPPPRWYRRRVPNWVSALVIGLAVLAGGVEAATPALRLNGLKFGANDGSVYLRAYGCVGDGATDDSTCFTNAVAALTAGSTLYVTPGNYLVQGPFALPADNITIQGSGTVSSTITQKTAGFNTFSAAARSGVTMRDIAFVGVAGATHASGNTVLKNSTSIDNLTVRGCRFTNFQDYAIWVHAGTRINVSDNTFVGTLAYLQEGGSNTTFARNIVRDPQTPNTIFVVPLQFDSTSAGGGVNVDVTVTDNQFLNWNASQNILLHSGNGFVIANNVITNGYYGIAMGVFQAGDTLQDGTITGNSITNSTSSGLAGIANVGIDISGIVGQPVQRISIVGNRILNSNGYDLNDNRGCILLAGNMNDVLVSSNILDTCYGNAIATIGANSNRLTIVDNHIDNVQDSTGTFKVGIGVYTNTTQSGWIANNFINSVRQGIRFDIATSFVVGQHTMTNVATTRIVNPTNATVNQFADGALATGSSNIDFSGGSGILKVPTGGMTGSGGAVDFSADSSTFSSPTGANTFGGSSNAFTNSITTPSIDRSGAGAFNMCSGNCTTSIYGNSGVTSLQITALGTGGTIKMSGALQCSTNAIAQSTASMTLDASRGCFPVVTLTASVTAVTLTNFPLGQRYCATFVQGGAGSFTVTGWPANAKWLPTAYRGTTHTAPTLTTAVGARDTLCWMYDGTNLLQISENLNN